ncbi:GDP-mannose 4,6-dehydratase [Verrucomicrobia bacterium]|nr:GDP-mannose 4,6-dehydratase [Verrucomicrobiota bacterium]
MSTYLVTGVAGFIASKTAEFLLKDGHTVVGVDNMNDYYDVRLKQHRLDLLKNESNFEFHQLDIESEPDLKQLFEQHRIEGVLNLAARAGVRYSLENPHVYMTTNAMGTLHLLECMRHHDVKKMVLASTSSLYAGQEMPFTEKLPVNTPISPYAASKKAAEVMGYSYHNLFDLDISVVRYFTVFGPCGRPDMSIFRFIKWIAEGTPMELFGDGTQSRDFTYVDDIARGTIAALKPIGYEIFNLGGGNNPISLSQIIHWIEESLGKKAIIENKPFHKADMKSTWADISKAEELLGWKPQVDIKEGVENCVQWYLDNQSWLKDIKV